MRTPQLSILRPPATLSNQERLAFYGLFLMASLLWWQEIDAPGHWGQGLIFFACAVVALGNLTRGWQPDTPLLQLLERLSPSVCGVLWGLLVVNYPVSEASAVFVYMLLSVLLLLGIVPFGSFNAFVFSLPLLVANNALIAAGPWPEAMHINLLLSLNYFVFWYASMRASPSHGSSSTVTFTEPHALGNELQRLREVMEADRQDRQQLEARLKQKERDLEQEIDERTHALQEANTQLSQQIALRKTISDALVKSQTRLTQAIDASRLGLIDWDVANQQFYQSAFHDLFGEKEQETATVIATLKKVIHPLDYENVRDTLNAALLGEQDDYQLQYRVANDDAWLWIEECGRVVDKNEQGHALRILGTRRNIHSEMLRDEQVRLAKSVFDHTSEGVFVLDDEARYLSVNPAYCKITGHSAAAIEGKKLLEISQTPEKEQVFAQIQRKLRERGSWQGELLERRHQGDYFPQWTQVNAIFDDQGRIKYYAGLISDLSDRKATDEKLDYLINYDALTHLANRVQFRDQLHRALLRYKDDGTPFALVSLDLDRFKQFNDSFGQAGADTLLRDVAERLSRHVQKIDILARVGGNEFACIVACTPQFDVNAFAERLLTCVTQKSYILEGHELMLSCSVGVALVPEHAEDIEHLLQYAALAIAKAKFMGGNQVQMFDDALVSFSRQRLEIEQDLRKALSNDELEVYYQPKLDLKTRQIHSYEALIRWQHPVKGLVSPDDFVNIAEESGLISDLGTYVLQHACRQTQAWQQEGLGNLQVSVNLSTRQLRDPGLLQVIQQALQESGINPACVELELTESAVMEDLHSTVAVLQTLRELGLKISIDDFGTGYSSLSYLRELPADTLKIDRAFVEHIEHSKDQQAIARAIIVLGNSLNMQIVAEGVENDSQLARLEAYGCDFVQGYHISKPLTAAGMHALLNAQQNGVNTTSTEAPSSLS